jgi:hypothetical protein
MDTAGRAKKEMMGMARGKRPTFRLHAAQASLRHGVATAAWGRGAHGG